MGTAKHWIETLKEGDRVALGRGSPWRAAPAKITRYTSTYIYAQTASGPEIRLRRSDGYQPGTGWEFPYRIMPITDPLAVDALIRNRWVNYRNRVRAHLEEADKLAGALPGASLVRDSQRIDETGIRIEAMTKVLAETNRATAAIQQILATVTK